jgi:hypothetical protein
MGNSAASNKIDMRGSELPASSQQAAQFERLLKECREICLERLSTSLAGMLDKVPGALWDLADQAREPETRDLYMEAKVNAPAQRKRIEAEFRTNYLAEFAAPARREKKGAAFSQFDSSALELGLVTEGDLEEALKVNGMAAKQRRDCEDELAAMDQQLDVLVGDASLRGESNPFGPQAICRAFKLTCRALEPNLKLRLVLLTLFDEHVLDDIRSIYKDLNTTLVGRSFPPQICHGMLRRPAGSVVAARGGAAATVAAAGLPAALSARAVGASEQEAFGVLQNPLSGGGGAGATGSAQPALGTAIQAPSSPPILDTSGMSVAQGPLESPQGTSLVASLTRIQRGGLSALTRGNVALAANLATPGTTNVLRELRGTSLASGLDHMDSVTLDILALLFDQIFAYEEIPPLMKGLIGQLQIPMLKVAILDKSLLCTKTHSARKLLDCLGDIAVSLNADFDEGSPLYGQIQKTVRELVDGFEDSMEIFDRLHEELERFVAWQNQGVEEQAVLVAKRIEYKERLSLAKAVAQQAILQRANSRSIPRVVLRFLADQWIKVMLIAHAKHGDESEAWNKAVGTMDLLIWSVRAKHSLAERRTLAAVLPRLLNRLDNGMRKIGTQADDRKRFFITLMRCHTKAMNAALSKHVGPADPALPAGPVLTAEAPVLAVSEELKAASAGLSGQAPGSSGGGTRASKPHAPAATPGDDDTEPAAAPPEFCALTIRNPFGEGGIQIEEISLSDLPAGGNVALGASGTGNATGGDVYSHIAGSLREGAWVDFRDVNGNKRQRRLFYISPLRRTYVFVNRQSGNVSEYSLYQLAREFRAGRASVIETMPLFDRAMGSLVDAQRTGATLQ